MIHNDPYYQDRSWVVEGAAVAEYSNGYNGSVALTTIERLTKTQIVLANGRRYNRGSLRLVGNYYGAELLPAKHRSVLDVLAQTAFRNLAQRVWSLDKSFRGDRDAALANIRRIEEMAAEARNNIEELAQ
ncbi:hypothetical protein O7614_26890 [Micromonospora sp. WMMD961]|uniref:hypothetical protein n=1 Tax=Micromonospora sp. WMMD961 TaxID=3016100 RepID=UPI0024180A8F|nr:hypothetical protein [Micromonospora sp. WMMD961]MDG4783290.1 hypothetical protein [Micromonospora sp. WMMD961]